MGCGSADATSGCVSASGAGGSALEPEDPVSTRPLELRLRRDGRICRTQRQRLLQRAVGAAFEPFRGNLYDFTQANGLGQAGAMGLIAILGERKYARHATPCSLRSQIGGSRQPPVIARASRAWAPTPQSRPSQPRRGRCSLFQLLATPVSRSSSRSLRCCSDIPGPFGICAAAAPAPALLASGIFPLRPLATGASAEAGSAA